MPREVKLIILSNFNASDNTHYQTWEGVIRNNGVDRGYNSNHILLKCSVLPADYQYTVLTVMHKDVLNAST